MHRHLLTTTCALLFLQASGAAAEGFLNNGVTAHRGDSINHPENTMPAFEAGIAAGADWLELDILPTADGQLVVSHDKTTKRVGDRAITIEEASYEDVRAVDVATEFRRRNNLSLKDCPPQRMPLLREVLALVQRQGRTRVSIQPKSACVAETVALVKEMKAERWVGFNDGSLELMSEAKRLAPDLPVFWDRRKSDVAEDIKIAKERGFESLVLHQDDVTPEKVDQIHRSGLECGVWTVNEDADWKRFLNIGVRRIYTDDPGGLLKHQGARGFGEAACAGTYRFHLQGFCVDPQGAIYWSWTDGVVKTDSQGRLLCEVPAANHHGDVCYLDGKVYCAVNLGKFNQPPGKEDSWVYVYDANTLAELGRHRVPELVHGAGGIATDGKRFLVVGGLPPEVEENYLYEYDLEFRFVKRHVLASGHTDKGIQTAAYADGSWWFGCYGKPAIMLRADNQFGLTGKWEFNASVGLADVGNGRFLLASNRRTADGRNFAKVILATPDPGTGLAVMSETPAPAKAHDLHQK